MTIEQIEVLGKNSSKAFEIYLKNLFIKEFNKINLKEKEEEQNIKTAASVVSEGISRYFFEFEKKNKSEADKYFDRYLNYLRNGSSATSFGWLWEYVCAKMLETKYKIEEVEENDPNFDIIFKTEGMLRKELFKGGLMQCKSSFVSQKMMKNFKAHYTKGKKINSEYYRNKENYIKKYPNFFYSVFLGLNSQTKQWYCKSSTYFEKIEEELQEFYKSKSINESSKDTFFFKKIGKEKNGKETRETIININSKVLKEISLFTTKDINAYFAKDIHKWLISLNNHKFNHNDYSLKEIRSIINKNKPLAIPFLKKETSDDDFITRVKNEICKSKGKYSLVFDNTKDYQRLNNSIKYYLKKGYDVKAASEKIIKDFTTTKGNKIGHQKEIEEIEEEISYFNY